jgi:hypothetical protein
MRVGNSAMLDVGSTRASADGPAVALLAPREVSAACNSVAFALIEVKSAILLGRGAEAYLKEWVSDARLDLSRPSFFHPCGDQAPSSAREAERA